MSGGFSSFTAERVDIRAVIDLVGVLDLFRGHIMRILPGGYHGPGFLRNGHKGIDSDVPYVLKYIMVVWVVLSGPINWSDVTPVYG